MANNLGFIDVENNNLLNLASNLGKVKGTNTGSGQIASLSNDSSSDTIDYYRFELDATAPANSYIELSSPDVVNIEAFYKMILYRYDAATDTYTEIKQSYQLNNNPFSYRIDLKDLGKGTYVFGVIGTEWDFGNATGAYNLRISVPSSSLPGKVINGTSNAETLTGGSEENTINGQGGNDTLKGGGGDDTLKGGDGNDILTGGANSDLIDGGNGTDRVVESGDLAEFVLTNGRLIGNGVDVLISVEQAQLTGGAGWNKLDASGFTLGSVTLSGGGSDDTILGGSKNDSLKGDDGFDSLSGGAGKDTMIGGSGGDIYVVDNVGDIITETNTSIFEIDLVKSSVTYTLGANVEDLTLTGSAAINATGNNLDNWLIGNSGNNSLEGLKGIDTLDGGSGVDTLTGGDGNDTYIVDNKSDSIVETSTTNFEVVKSSAGTYTLSANLENLEIINSGIEGIGNGLGNKISGNGLNNTLKGVDGSDTIYGSYGNDTLYGGDGNDLLYGEIDNDVLNGGNGQDYLDGGVGNDTLNGGAGQDGFNDSLGVNTYVFQYGQSTFSAPDQVDSFTIGSDKIDLLTQSGATMGKPNSLTRAADTNDFGLSQDAINKIFTDANGKLSGNQPLGINSAAIVETFGFFNAYLIINDGTAGFQANNDLVINLATFGTMPDLGSIPVDTFFV